MKSPQQSESTLNFEKVWLMFQETEKQFKETDLKFKETDLKFKETDLKFKETDKKFQESREEIREAREHLKETERILKEQSQITDKEIEKVSKLLGGLSNNIGESVEDFFYYGFEQNPIIGNIQFEQVVQRFKTFKSEYDIVLKNGKYIALVEVKHKFHPNDLEKFISKKVSSFKTEFLAYKDYIIIACIAGFTIPKDTKGKANEMGVFVFTQSGDNIKSLNSKTFRFTEF